MTMRGCFPATHAPKTASLLYLPGPTSACWSGNATPCPWSLLVAARQIFWYYLSPKWGVGWEAQLSRVQLYGLSPRAVPAQSCLPHRAMASH